MGKVWCTCYKCKENTEGGAYVSKSTRTRHRKENSIAINIRNPINEDVEMTDTFKYILIFILISSQNIL